MLTTTERTRCEKAQAKALETGRVSRQLLRAVCVECIYDPADEGTARAQIARCTVEACPLHPIRHLWAGEAAQDGSNEQSDDSGSV